ncbi:MAG: hypothetical protein H5U37_02900 [Caldisericia bacterium]|nr:hypothetical protein [Caldisericia bacterium]
MLSLRKIEGVSLSSFEKRFGKINMIDKLKEFQKKSFIDFKNEKVFLTNKGILVSNEIFSDLI